MDPNDRESYTKRFWFRWHNDRQNNSNSSERNPDDQPNINRNFGVFSSPLEMESFFSQQLDEVLKRFGLGQFGGPGFYGKFKNSLNY